MTSVDPFARIRADSRFRPVRSRLENALREGFQGVSWNSLVTRAFVRVISLQEYAVAPPTDNEDASKEPIEPVAADASAGSEPDTDLDDDDGSPDPMRLTILAGVLLVLVGVWIWTALHPPAKKYYTDLPGVRLDALTPAQREMVVKEANATACACGSATCTNNVAECRTVEPTTCDTSLRLIGVIVRRVTGRDAEFEQPLPPGFLQAIRPAPAKAAPSAAHETARSAAPSSAPSAAAAQASPPPSDAVGAPPASSPSAATPR